MFDRGKLIRYRNILLYKMIGSSSCINTIINYRPGRHKLNKYKLKSFINVDDIDIAKVSNNTKYVGWMAANNRFNLLGSGWVRYDEKVTNRTYGIQWNVDIKTGYEWPLSNIDEATSINSPYGTDIKNVWELGRMNYLVPLALYIVSEQDSSKKKEVVERFKGIVSDFIINNPIGKGVNWILAMEASIRLVNILISCDIVGQVGESYLLDKDFLDLIVKSVYQHIKFIWNNLEKSVFSGENGNHYYSNVVCLLIGISYLEHKDCHIDRIFKYCKREFIRETINQFYDEGGHFEQSSGYFRFTAEMAVFGAAFFLGNEEDLPENVKRRLYNNKKLAECLRKSDGTYFSFGDCDNGRLVKTGIYGELIDCKEAESKYQLCKRYSKAYGDNELFLQEDESNMDHLINYTKGLFNSGKRCSTIEGQIIQSITKGRRLELYKSLLLDGYEMEQNQSTKQEINLYSNLLTDYRVRKSIDIDLSGVENQCFETYLYKNMGFYVVKNENFSFFFRFGNDELIGHAHNDSLHFEYELKGESFFKDQGTCTYTGCPDKRNEYRSSASHNVPQYGCEQREFKGLFSYVAADSREIVEYNAHAIAIRYKNNEYDHIRRIVLSDSKLIIEDYGKRNFEMGIAKKLSYSPMYGLIERV